MPTSVAIRRGRVVNPVKTFNACVASRINP